MDRAQIEDEIADLRLQRGHLASHGKDVAKINAELAARITALDTIADVDAAQIEQGRNEATQQHQLNIAVLRTELADLDTSMTKALAECETSLRIAAKAMRLHHQHAAAKRKALAELNRLTGKKTSIENEIQLHKKCSMLWLSQIRTITGHIGMYGDIKIPGVLALPDPNKSWT